MYKLHITAHIENNEARKAHNELVKQAWLLDTTQVVEMTSCKGNNKWYLAGNPKFSSMPSYRLRSKESLASQPPTLAGDQALVEAYITDAHTRIKHNEQVKQAWNRDNSLEIEATTRKLGRWHDLQSRDFSSCDLTYRIKLVLEPVQEPVPSYTISSAQLTRMQAEANTIFKIGTKLGEEHEELAKPLTRDQFFDAWQQNIRDEYHEEVYCNDYLNWDIAEDAIYKGYAHNLKASVAKELADIEAQQAKLEARAKELKGML